MADLPIPTPDLGSMQPSQSVVIGPTANDAPVQRGVINGATANINLAAALANRRIRVLSLFLVVTTTAVAITFQDAQGGTALTGAMTVLAGTPLVLPWNPHGWFESVAAGNLLNLFQSGTSQISGAYTYQYIDGTQE